MLFQLEAAAVVVVMTQIIKMLKVVVMELTPLWLTLVGLLRLKAAAVVAVDQITIMVQMQLAETAAVAVAAVIILQHLTLMEQVGKAALELRAKALMVVEV